MTRSQNCLAILAALGSLMLPGGAARAADAVVSAEEFEIEDASVLPRQQLVYAILKILVVRDVSIIGEGVVEVLQDGFGFLRSSDQSPTSPSTRPHSPCKWGPSVTWKNEDDSVHVGMRKTASSIQTSEVNSS